MRPKIRLLQDISRFLTQKNTWADLSRLATFEYNELNKIYIKYLDASSIDIPEEVHQVQVGHKSSWGWLIHRIPNQWDFTDKSYGGTMNKVTSTSICAYRRATL